jgi:hypothetical protein
MAEEMFELLRSQAVSLPPLAKFALGWPHHRRGSLAFGNHGRSHVRLSNHPGDRDRFADRIAYATGQADCSSIWGQSTRARHCHCRCNGFVRHVLSCRVRNLCFALTFGTMAIAGVLAQAVDLPGIVGVFLAGLALNEAVRDKPAKDKLEFFGNSFFIPIFFIEMGFLIDPRAFVQSIVDNFAFVMALVVALSAGKFMAAQIAGRAFEYGPAARMTMWSLTLPQVASTLAAALVAFRTFNPLHQPLIDHRMLDAVFVLMVTTAILGPVLTQYFAPRILGADNHESRARVARSSGPVE